MMLVGIRIWTTVYPLIVIYLVLLVELLVGEANITNYVEADLAHDFMSELDLFKKLQHQ